ncbi:hypothetical protein V2J09_005919 [Rumex salicifolius]
MNPKIELEICGFAMSSLSSVSTSSQKKLCYYGHLVKEYTTHTDMNYGGGAIDDEGPVASVPPTVAAQTLDFVFFLGECLSTVSICFLVVRILVLGGLTGRNGLFDLV